MEPFYKKPDFWYDVTANLVAFAIVITTIVIVENVAGRHIGFLHG